MVKIKLINLLNINGFMFPQEKTKNHIHHTITELKQETDERMGM